VIAIASRPRQYRRAAGSFLYNTQLNLEAERLSACALARKSRSVDGRVTICGAMNRPPRGMKQLLLSVSLGFGFGPPVYGAQSPGPALEEVYVFRSISPQVIFDKSAANLGPCPRAPFTATAYDLQDLFSIESRSGDGQLINPEVKKIGSLAACLAPAPGTPGTLLLYAEGYFDRGDNTRLSFINNGTCQTESQVPSSSTTFLRCFTSASGLPPGYIGGRTISSVLRGTGYLSTLGVARFFRQGSG
jgi:hypothetical protein